MRTLDAAECLVSFLRIRTDGNLLRVIGVADSPENKVLWAQHAPLAVQLAAQAVAKDSGSPKARKLYAEAMAMQASSKGIMEMATSGDLPVLQKAVKNPRAADAPHDLGIAWVFAGSNYLALPWPLGSAKKAKERFGEALQVKGDSARNLYHCTLAERAVGNSKEALRLFERAVEEARVPKSDCERDVAAFIAARSPRPGPSRRAQRQSRRFPRGHGVIIFLLWRMWPCRSLSCLQRLRVICGRARAAFDFFLPSKCNFKTCVWL